MKEYAGDTTSPEYHGRMEFLARQIDHLFNGGDGDLRGETGFVLLVFPFDRDRSYYYVSNASREDVAIILKEQIARLAVSDVVGD
jgi:hypothetical protein